MMSYHPLAFDFLNILLFEEDAVVMEAAGVAVVAEASVSIIAWTAAVETVVP